MLISLMLIFVNQKHPAFEIPNDIWVEECRMELSMDNMVRFHFPQSISDLMIAILS